MGKAQPPRRASATQLAGWFALGLAFYLGSRGAPAAAPAQAAPAKAHGSELLPWAARGGPDLSAVD